jgi:hypothetical protein
VGVDLADGIEAGNLAERPDQDQGLTDSCRRHKKKEKKGEQLRISKMGNLARETRHLLAILYLYNTILYRSKQMDGA